MPELDRELSCASRLRLFAGHPVEGPARSLHRDQSGVSSTAQEGVDDEEREEVARRFRADSDDAAVAGNIVQQLRRLERHLSGGRLDGACDSEAQRTRQPYAADGILSLSAKIYQLRRHRDAGAAPDTVARRSGTIPCFEAGIVGRKTGPTRHLCDCALTGPKVTSGRRNIAGLNS